MGASGAQALFNSLDSGVKNDLGVVVRREDLVLSHCCLYDFLYHNFLICKMGEPRFPLLASSQSKERENNEVIKHHKDEYINLEEVLET